MPVRPDKSPHLGLTAKDQRRWEIEGHLAIVDPIHTGGLELADTIHAVAIHHLHRGESDQYEVITGNSSIAVSQTAKRLIDELQKLYARRASKAYGKFSTDTVNYPTSTHLGGYLRKEVDFEKLTLALMATLAKEAGARAASTGGHVFFAHFARDGSEFLLVAIVTDKLSAALTDNTDLEDVKHLDVEGFRFAGRVSLSGWAANEERYISFLKGKGSVSEYFKDFLGCDTTIQSRVETTNLVSALKSFADGQNFDANQRESFMSRALDICDRDARADKPVGQVAIWMLLRWRTPPARSDELDELLRSRLTVVSLLPNAVRNANGNSS